MTASPELPVSARPARVQVAVRDLTLQAGSRILLQNADAQFAAGEITLIVGRSGVGKSTLLKVIAGLLDERDEALRMSGAVEVNNADGSPCTTRHSVGVVFQDFALFDELTPLENVQLARAHRPRRVRDDALLEPRRLLDELGVPHDVPTHALSGGQRQRLAIARTLAYDPDIMLYDEPTSGLDSATADEVTRVIEATHVRHPCTAMIVTHDYESLSRIAQAVYLIDTETCTLRQIPREQWPHLSQLLAQSRASGEELLQVETGRAPAWLRHAGSRLRTFLTETSRVLEACADAAWRLVPLWNSPRWGGRFLLHYLRAVASPSAWLYIAIAGAIIGFVATYFTFRFLPSANYTKPLVIEDLLRSMGFALYRILVPILATILIAARCGAAVAADVGGKRYGRQMDALRTLGVDPKRYLLTGILYAFLLGTPWLLTIGYATAALTSLIVFTTTHPARGPWFWQLHFHRELVVPDQWYYAGSAWLLAKTLTCAAGIALIAYARGARPKDSSRAVSRGVTSTILWSTLYVLAVHFVFAFVEFG
ncbi:MAG: ABC transporter permease [Pirellulaceae bacterium]|jgi:ABC-type polar amino acid transport system ATPase subunit/ABC-type transporter Mla maintaining outer membrane lipid asymmetry permease subunit MlaE|nr:ABC transporter permease [Pirellulaceae bacterium]